LSLRLCFLPAYNIMFCMIPLKDLIGIHGYCTVLLLSL
jgi:hypothetical protein